MYIESDAGLDELCCAIIAQAVKDYASINFFKSDWYALLTTNLPLLRDGEAVYIQMKKNHEAKLPANLHRLHKPNKHKDRWGNYYE